MTEDIWACMLCGVRKDAAVFARCVREAIEHGLEIAPGFEEQVHMWIVTRVSGDYKPLEKIDWPEVPGAMKREYKRAESAIEKIFKRADLSSNGGGE